MRAALLALAVAALGCSTRLGPLPGGYALQGSGNGIVIGRIEWLNGDGQPRYCVPCLFGMDPVFEWKRAMSFESYLIGLDGMVSDFSVALPPGRYFWIADQCIGLQKLVFTLEPGQVIYLGTIRFQPTGLISCRPTIVDDYDASVERFRSQHPDLARQVEKSLVRWD